MYLGWTSLLLQIGKRFVCVCIKHLVVVSEFFGVYHYDRSEAKKVPSTNILEDCVGEPARPGRNAF